MKYLDHNKFSFGKCQHSFALVLNEANKHGMDNAQLEWIQNEAKKSEIQ